MQAMVNAATGATNCYRWIVRLRILDQNTSLISTIEEEEDGLLGSS